MDQQPATTTSRADQQSATTLSPISAVGRRHYSPRMGFFLFPAWGLSFLSFSCIFSRCIYFFLPLRPDDQDDMKRRNQQDVTIDPRNRVTHTVWSRPDLGPRASLASSHKSPSSDGELRVQTPNVVSGRKTRAALLGGME